MDKRHECDLMDMLIHNMKLFQERGGVAGSSIHTAFKLEVVATIRNTNTVIMCGFGSLGVGTMGVNCATWNPEIMEYVPELVKAKPLFMANLDCETTILHYEHDSPVDIAYRILAILKRELEL